MRKRIISFALTLCLCISSQSVVYAWQEDLQQDAATAESVSGLAADDSAVPSPTEVYEAMTALKEQDAYKEGTPWTNDEPYSASKGYYRWKGGTLGGKNIVAAGCVAFAFILSDEAFGSLPGRMYAAGEFAFEDIKAGDILRMNTDTHTVIVLEVNDAGVVIAEGNISTGGQKGRVHWGRAISKEVVMNDTSHYITRYPEGYISPDDSAANEIIGKGPLGGGLAWKLTKAGTLTISGSGPMPDYSSAEEQPWSVNSSQIREVVIENGVTSIGACAFFNCGVLSAEIPSSVTTIGNSAFCGSSIISVTVPSSVKTIGDSAFRECQNLSSAAVSEGVETIEQNAFRACTSLISINLPASVGKVGAAAFFECTEMKSATFAPGSKKVEMGDNMFTRCYYLMNVTLPQSIDRISDGMFTDCLMLGRVKIPEGAESIGVSAFASCSRLTEIGIPNSVKTIGTGAFQVCQSLSNIYFGGTEAEWNAICRGDTIAAVSNVTKHYNAALPTNPDPDDGNKPGGGSTGSGDGTGDGSTGSGDGTGDGNTGSGDGTGGGSTGSGDGTGGGSTGSGDGTGGGNTGSGNKPGSGDNSGDSNPGDGDNSGDSADISQASVTLSQTSYIYDGKAKTPSVTVKLGEKTLVLNTDYTVSYSNNINAGTAEVTVTGKGNYSGSLTARFTITKAADQDPSTSITCKKTVYEVASGKKPFKINASSNSGMTFTSSDPKIVAVDKNTGKISVKRPGIVTITIRAGGASENVTVRVNPKKQSVKTAKSVKGKKLAVKWAKDKTVSGCQVQISTDKKFKKNVKSKRLTKTSYTFKKLKAGKKYYVRVRSYKKAGKETLYGAWSKVKLGGKIKK